MKHFVLALNIDQCELWAGDFTSKEKGLVAVIRACAMSILSRSTIKPAPDIIGWIRGACQGEDM